MAVELSRFHKYQETYKKYEKTQSGINARKRSISKTGKTSLHYFFKKSFGGNRDKVLERDQFKCVGCFMNAEEHKEKYGRNLTIDHIDRNRQNNDLTNLQTLCCRCHGIKDRNIVVIRNGLTMVESKILSYWSKYYFENNTWPSQLEAMRDIGYRSPTTIHDTLKRLAKKGFISRNSKLVWFIPDLIQ